MSNKALNEVRAAYYFGGAIGSCFPGLLLLWNGESKFDGLGILAASLTSYVYSLFLKREAT